MIKFVFDTLNLKECFIFQPSEEIYENLCTFENDPASAYNTQSDASIPDQCSMQDINDADDRMKRFYGTHVLISQSQHEKQLKSTISSLKK